MSTTPVTLDLSKAVPISQPVQLDMSKAQSIGSSPTPPEPEGFWHSLGAQFGLTPEASEAAYQHMKEHPISTAAKAALGPAGALVEGLYNQAKQSGGELVQAGKSALEGNPAGVASHAISAVPIVGAAMNKATDQYADQNYMGEMGTLTGAAAQAAPAALTASDAALPNRPTLPTPKLPSRSNAASVFSDLNTKLADQPVPLKATLDPLQRATEIGARGGTLPKAVSDLLTRSQSPIDMTFPEARDYQMALTDLSRADVESISPRMKGQIARVNQGLFNDIHAAAEQNQPGLGGDFADAMKEYRQASQIRDVAKTAAKYAIPAAVGTGLASHYLKELIP